MEEEEYIYIKSTYDDEKPYNMTTNIPHRLSVFHFRIQEFHII